MRRVRSVHVVWNQFYGTHGAPGVTATWLQQAVCEYVLLVCMWCPLVTHDIGLLGSEQGVPSAFWAQVA
jgi:hypothetical protein